MRNNILDDILVLKYIDYNEYFANVRSNYDAYYILNKDRTKVYDRYMVYSNQYKIYNYHIDGGGGRCIKQIFNYDKVPHPHSNIYAHTCFGFHYNLLPDEYKEIIKPYIPVMLETIGKSYNF